MRSFLSFIILIFFSITALGQDPNYGSEFQVNTLIEGSPTGPIISGLSNGGFIICWESLGHNGDDTEIFAQLFDSLGQKVGGEFLVNTYTINSQSNPSVTTLSNSHFVVSWQSLEQDGSAYGIFAQLFDNFGVKISAEFQVNSNTSNNQKYPDISTLNNGRFVICWESMGQVGNSYGIFAQIFDNLGAKVGGEFKVNDDTVGVHRLPRIATLNNNRFVICWQSSEDLWSNEDIFAQIFDTSGVRIGNKFLVEDENFQGFSQYSPRIGSLQNGGFIICWNLGGGPIIAQAQRFDGDGSKVGGYLINGSGLFPRQAEVEGLSSGEFVFCFETLGYDGDGELFGELYDETSTYIGGFQINSTFHGRQALPKVAKLNNGNFVICWTNEKQDKDGYDVYGKYYLAEPIVHNLTSFELIYPASGDTISIQDTLFLWNKPTTKAINFPWELTYEIFIDDNINFSTPQTYKFIQDTLYQMHSLSSYNQYYWKVLARNFNGDSLWCSDPFNFYIDPNYITNLNESKLPNDFQLYQNYPNPFNPITKIKFTVAVVDAKFASTTNVVLKIYNILGNEIATLVDEAKTTGTYEVEFDASDFSSGVYFYQLKAGKYSTTKKMLLIK
jgi:hypothetical protein